MSGYNEACSVVEFPQGVRLETVYSGKQAEVKSFQCCEHSTYLRYDLWQVVDYSILVKINSENSYFISFRSFDTADLTGAFFSKSNYLAFLR